MALAISLLTISTISFLVATFMHNFAYGVTWSLLLHVVHYMVFGSGYILPTSQIFVNYFWSTLVFGVAGWILAMLLRIPAFLNGAYYASVFPVDSAVRKRLEDDKRTLKDESEWMIFGKFLIPLLLIGIGHIIYELNVDGFPKWAGGIVLVVLDIIAWIAFYFLFRPDDKHFTLLFNSSDPRAEVATISFNMAAATIIYALTYIIFQSIDCLHFASNAPNVYTDGECSIFYGDQWYFYASLIAGGFVIVWSVVVGFCAGGVGNGYLSTNQEYKGLKHQA